MSNNCNNCLANMGIVKGVLAIIFGCMFIIMAYSIILRMIFFSAGLFLVYYGMKELKVPQFETSLKKAKDYISKKMS